VKLKDYGKSKWAHYIVLMKDRISFPKMRPRALKDGSGWYILVEWFDRPSEQVGGFPTEDEAKHWVFGSSASWLRARWQHPLS
jgi:hypothetical protein